MAESWQDALRDWEHHPEWEVRVTTGTEHFRKGLVTLEIRGDGSARVRNRRAGRDLPVREGKVPTEEVQELGSRLAALDLGRLPAGDQPRVPGDTPVSIEIREGTTTRVQARCWHSDRYDLPALDRFLEKADDLVLGLTDGELPF